MSAVKKTEHDDDVMRQEVKREQERSPWKQNAEAYLRGFICFSISSLPQIKQMWFLIEVDTCFLQSPMQAKQSPSCWEQTRSRFCCGSMSERMPLSLRTQGFIPLIEQDNLAQKPLSSVTNRK